LQPGAKAKVSFWVDFGDSIYVADVSVAITAKLKAIHNARG
jgi:hypothetical protein